MIGDQDFFRVDLVAGRTYDIGEYLVTGGPSGVPLSDAYIELYDAAGNLVTTADGGGPDTPSGLDALLTFVPQTSGTYYINARGFDQDPTNGTTGDAVGDYKLFVNDVTGKPTVYALLRRRQPAPLDRLGQPGRPHARAIPTGPKGRG
jgi:serralysin